MAEEVGRMQVVLTADTAQHDKALQASEKQQTATSRAGAKAARELASAQELSSKLSSQAVTSEAQRTLAARRELKQSVRDYAQVLSATKRGYLDEQEGSRAAVAAIQREIAARKELSSIGRPAPVERVESHGFSDRMAASATVRGLSGNPGIRSVENFITTIPGVSTAVRGLFPLIGAAGLAGLFVEMGEKGYEAFEKVKNAAAETRNAFQATHDTASVSIDDLEIENQKIQDQINKISGHPNNGLASALLEAKKMADQLIVSLQGDRKELEALLKENSVGVFGRLLTGVASTGKQSKELLNDQGSLISQQRDADLEFGAKTAGVKDPRQLEQAAAAYKAKVHDIYQAQIDGLHREKTRLDQEQKNSFITRDVPTGPSTGLEGLGVTASQTKKTETIESINNAAKIENVSGRARQLQDAQREADLQAQILAGNTKLGEAKQVKDNAALARKALEAAQKANEQKLKSMEAALAQLKLNGNVTAKAEFDYWAERRSAFATGSQQYNQVIEKQSQLATEGGRKFAEGIAKIKREAMKQEGDPLKDAEMARTIEAVNKAYLDSLKEMDRARDTNTDAGNEVAAIRSRAAATEAETAINEAAGRTITKQDALRQLALLHAQQYGAQIDALNAKAKQVADASYLTDAEKASQLRQIGEQGAHLEAQRSETVARDQYALNPGGTSAAVGAKDALDELADSAKDSAGQLRSFIGETLSKFNDTAVDMLTRRHYPGDHTIRNAGADLFRSGTGALLKKGEGELGGLLGFGNKSKPTGTAGDPLHVVLAGMSGVNIPGVPSSLSSLGANALGGNPLTNQQNLFSSLFSGLYPGGSTDALASTASAVASGASSAASGAGDVLSGLATFADGTPPLSQDTMALVGERGPELAYLGKGTGIVPNHKLGSMGGGTTHHWNIPVDARAATDPAMVRKMVNEGIMQAAPHIAAAAVGRVGENRKRGPATRA